MAMPITPTPGRLNFEAARHMQRRYHMQRALQPQPMENPMNHVEIKVEQDDETKWMVSLTAEDVHGFHAEAFDGSYPSESVAQTAADHWRTAMQSGIAIRLDDLMPALAMIARMASTQAKEGREIGQHTAAMLALAMQEIIDVLSDVPIDVDPIAFHRYCTTHDEIDCTGDRCNGFGYDTEGNHNETPCAFIPAPLRGLPVPTDPRTNSDV